MGARSTTVHVRRGSEATPEADREASQQLLERVRDSGDQALRVWYPPRQVAFGRRDVAAEGYPRARQAAADHGYPPTERETGGRAVAFTGDVMAVWRADPADADEFAIDERYERFLAELEAALADLGVEISRDEPPNSFCPGTRSLSADGKVAGLGQRVHADVAVTAGILVVRSPESVAAVLQPVYEALGIPFEPESVGSLAGAGCGATNDGVRQHVEDALVGDAEPTVRRP